MKKLIITCALLTCASLVSFGQNSQPAPASTTMHARPPMGAPTMSIEQRAERHARSEEKQLNLSPEQYKSAYEAELEMTKKVEELKATGQPKKEDFMAVNAQKEEKFKRIFTAEQMVKYQAMNNRQHPAPAPNAPANQPGVPMQAK